MTAPVKVAERFADQALPYSAQLYGTALRLTGNRAGAEDLVQETGMRAHAGFRTSAPQAGHRRTPNTTGPPSTRAATWRL